jgi:hypothetical protein
MYKLTNIRILENITHIYLWEVNIYLYSFQLKAHSAMNALCTVDNIILSCTGPRDTYLQEPG